MPFVGMPINGNIDSLEATWRYFLKLIAHRGGRGFGPDNTLEAMERAVDAGVSAIETDVRRTLDERLIICHDALIRNHSVARTTYEELMKHDPERPLLTELLENLAGRVEFNIEVKDAPEELLGETLEAYGLGPETLVTSFQKTFLEKFKDRYPYVRTGYLYRMAYREDRKVENAVAMGAEVVLPYFQSIDRGLVDQAHSLGLEVFAWTVNSEDDARGLMELGVDGLVTDRYMDMKAFLEGQLAEVD